MADKVEYDWPPTMRYHRRRPRVEVFEPEEPPTRHHHHVEITVRHHRRALPRFLPVFLVVVAVLLLWRLKFGILMLAALVGYQMIGAALFVVAVLAVLAWRDRWARRRSKRPPPRRAAAR
jgi:hypothetical protein